MSLEENKAGASPDVAVCAGGSAQLPSFWRDDPEGWFLNCESQFFAKNIKLNVTKYHYCVAKLDSDTSRRVRDLVRAPVNEESYAKLKSRLCQAFELTEAEKIDKMLGTSALGDRKPSELMADLVELCPEGADATTFVKRIFMRSLPVEVRSVLSQSGELRPRQLGEAADKVWISVCRTAGPAQAVNAVAGPFLCKWHKKWGDKARRCKKQCAKFEEHIKKAANKPKQTNEVEAEPWTPTTDLPKNV